jgi:hypothetical protein
MVELRKYAKVIQNSFAKEHSPNKNFGDYIDENQWLNKVVKEIDKLSLECAKELQKEFGLYPKCTTEYPEGQPLEVAPPYEAIMHKLNPQLLAWMGND